MGAKNEGELRVASRLIRNATRAIREGSAGRDSRVSDGKGYENRGIAVYQGFFSGIFPSIQRGYRATPFSAGARHSRTH